MKAKRNESSLAAPVAKPDERPPPALGLLRLFVLFSQLGLSSFGGNLTAWIHRELVERRRLIGEMDFIAALGVCRIMPGATVVNLAVVIGRQLRGAAGATTAVLGLLLGPSLLVLAFALVYRRFAGAPAFHAVLEGAAAASVGLIIAMGLSIGARLIGFGRHSNRGGLERDDFSSNRHPAPTSSWSMMFSRKPVSTFRHHALAPAGALAIIAATFVLIGVARFPMVPTVLCLAPISIGLARFWPASPRAEASDGGG